MAVRVAVLVTVALSTCLAGAALAQALHDLTTTGIAAAIAAELNFEISRDPIASPVDRLVVAPLVLLGAVLPLLLETAWRSTSPIFGTRMREQVPRPVRSFDARVSVE